MLRFEKYPLVILTLIFIGVVVSFFFTNDFAFEFEGYNYLIFQVLLFVLVFVLKDQGVKFLLSPSFIAVSYVNINFWLGSYVFKTGNVFTRLLPTFDAWENYDHRIFFFNAINFLIILSYFLTINLRLKRRKLPILLDIKRINPKKLFLATVVIFLLISPFKFPFSIVFKSLLAIIMFTLISQRFSLRKRIFFYVLIIFIFVLFSSHSKREAIFLLLPIFLLESYKIRIKLSIKLFLKVFVASFLLLYAIIAMSILRGYGGYKVDNFYDASGHVFDYMTSHFFMPAIVNNLEISSTYLHSNNSVEYLEEGKMDYLYGETFIKPLFIFFPRSIITKPKSSIGYYTETHDPEFRAKGGSFPISIQSEFYLNFGIYSLLLIVPFFMIFNMMYKTILIMIKNREIINFAYALYIYQIFLSLVRGSGLDIFLVYTIFLLFFFFLYKTSIKVFTLPLHVKV